MTSWGRSRAGKVLPGAPQGGEMTVQKREQSLAAPTAAGLVLEALGQLNWRSLLRGAGLLALAATTVAGIGAFLVAASLIDSQMEETRRVEGLTAQAIEGARTDQERFEKIVAFVDTAVREAGRGPWIDRTQWIQPPTGIVGALVARSTAASDSLRLFFEPDYETFLKPNALQVYYYSSDCAGASRLVIRMLAAIGIKASKIAIHDSAGVGRHAVVEAEVNGRRVIADANHGYVYHLPDGRLATAADLARDPEIARARLKPKDNPIIADFRDVKTMNWTKIPVLMPFAYKALHRLIGDRVNHIPRPAIVELPKLMSAAFFLFLGGLFLFPAAALAAPRVRRLNLRDRVPALPVSLRSRRQHGNERA